MLSLFQRRVATLTALLLAFFATTIPAQASTAQSTFFLEQTQTQFSLNLANDSTDVNIFFTSPAYSWVGVGFGEGMKNSLMIVMYPNEKGDNVTISPRIGTGHSEPSYASGIKMDILDGTGITDDDMFVLKAVCRSCRVWPGGFVDTNNKAHPMIYAFGPGSNIQSNDLNAGLHRHHVFGTFTMNMVAATGKGEVPANSTALNGVDLGPMHRDHDRANLAHAVMGCIALFVLWPLNLLFAGFLRNIRIHVGVSIFLMVFLVISYALGISTSSEYNRSKNFTSPHQIVAFISILPILLMSLLPLKRIAAMHSLIPRIHTSLTTTTYVALVLTGGLGLHLYSAPMPIITSYVAISLLVFVFLTLITFCVKRRGSAYARATTRRRLGEEDEADFGLAQYHAQRKLDEESSRSTSAASLHPQGHVQPQNWSHARSPSGGEQWRGNVYGGGSMPGPQYLLNMHPGVPVHFK